MNRPKYVLVDANRPTRITRSFTRITRVVANSRRNQTKVPRDAHGALLGQGEGVREAQHAPRGRGGRHRGGNLDPQQRRGLRELREGRLDVDGRHRLRPGRSVFHPGPFFPFFTC